MFKNLNLNRDKILKSIDSFCMENYSIYSRTDFIEMGPTRKRVQILCDENDFFMDFQFPKSGGTTIEVHGGKCLDIKNGLATYIINDSNCKIGNIKDRDSKFVAKDISQEDFDVIIDILKQSEYYKDCSYKKQQYSHEYKFIGSYNEHMTLSYYYTTNKAMAQGRPMLLFYYAIMLITELIDDQKISTVFNTMYELNIDKQNIIDQYDIHLPNSHDMHDGTLKSLLYQSIYYLNVTGNMFLYDGLVLPAFKALEGHLKIILYRDYNISCKKNKFLEYDGMVRSGNGDEILLGEEYVKIINNEKVVDYFNKSYNYYRQTRNPLCHFDSPNEHDPSGDLTFTIDSYNEANGIIREILRQIDEYYLL